MEGVGIDGVFDAVGKEGREVVVFFADAWVGGPEDPLLDLPEGGEGTVAGGVEVVVAEVVPIFEGAFVLSLGEVDIGEAGAFAVGLGLAEGEGVEGELEVGPAEVFALVLKAGLGGEVLGGLDGGRAGEVGLGGGLGTVGGLVIKEGKAAFAEIDAVDDAFDFEPFEGHFKGSLGGLDTRGAVDFEGFELALHEGLNASIEGFLLEAQGEGGLVAELLLKAARDRILEFAGEGVGFEVGLEFTALKLSEDIMEEGTKAGGGEFTGGEFSGAQAHDVAQEETEGAVEVIAEATGGAMLREGEVRWGDQSPGEAMGDGGGRRIVILTGFKTGFNALKEGGVLSLKEEAGGFGGGGVAEGLGEVATDGTPGGGAAAAERFEEVGIAGEALGFRAEAEAFAEGFREESVARASGGDDALVEPGEAELGRIVPEELEPPEEIVCLGGAFGVGPAFAEGLFKGEAVEGGGQFWKMLGGFGAGIEAGVEAVPIGTVAGLRVACEVHAERLREIGSLEEFAARAVDFFEGGPEVGVAAEMEAGLEVGGEVAFKEAVDFDEEGIGRDVGREPAGTEGVLQEGAQVLQTGLFAALTPKLGEVPVAAEVEGLPFGIVGAVFIFLQGALDKGAEVGIDDAEAMRVGAITDAFGEGGGSCAGIGASLELYAPVFEGEGALLPDFGAGVAPSIEALGGAVMPDFDAEGFGRLVEGEEGKGLRVGAGDEDDAFEGCGRLVGLCGVAAGEEGVSESAFREGGEVVLFKAGELTPAFAFHFGLGGFLSGGFNAESGLAEFVAKLKEALSHGEEPSSGGGGFLGKDGGVIRKVECFEARKPGGEDGAFPGGGRFREGFRKEGVGGVDGGEF